MMTRKQLSLRKYSAIFVFAATFFLLISISNCLLTSIKILVIYRLSEIFVIWVDNFLFPQWDPVNVYRTLLLVCLSYIEVIISYAFIYYFYNDQFIWISNSSKFPKGRSSSSEYTNSMLVIILMIS